MSGYDHSNNAASNSLGREPRFAVEPGREALPLRFEQDHGAGDRHVDGLAEPLHRDRDVHVRLLERGLARADELRAEDDRDLLRVVDVAEVARARTRCAATSRQPSVRSIASAASLEGCSVRSTQFFTPPAIM